MKETSTKTQMINRWPGKALSVWFQVPCLLLLMALSFQSQAQEGSTVPGKVKSESFVPPSGVNVVVKATLMSASANEDRKDFTQLIVDKNELNQI